MHVEKVHSDRIPFDAVVGRGAALLDKHKPDWFKLVKAPPVMWSCDRCVLGQVFGSFSAGLEALRRLEGCRIDEHSHGFSVRKAPRASKAWVDNGAVWVREILKRQYAAAAGKSSHRREVPTHPDRGTIYSVPGNGRQME
jgi:hypothetical protein